MDKDQGENIGKIVIVDEADSILYKNPTLFYTKTLHPDTRVVGLTATPDDNVEFGSERKILELLDFKFYYNTLKSAILEPKIHQHVNIPWDSTEKLRDLINSESVARPLLIYAIDQYYENCEKLGFI